MKQSSSSRFKHQLITMLKRPEKVLVWLVVSFTFVGQLVLGSHHHNQQQVTQKSIKDQSQSAAYPKLPAGLPHTALNRHFDEKNITTTSNNSSTASVLSPAEFVSKDWLFGAEEDLHSSESKHLSSFVDFSERSSSHRNNSSSKSKHRKSSQIKSKSSPSSSNNKQAYDDDQSEAANANGIFDESEDGESGIAGTNKEPECAAKGRYYCTYKEDYPSKLVTEVAKYYKWPLEKLFRDLHAQIMPKLAHDSTGNLVCDSITRVIRPGWARNTNDRWLVVINTESYHQYVTEVVCQYGTNSRCNFIPPCYYSSCQQRYNTQKLLVIDPNNPYRGPFLSEFLFPSCCVCYVPSVSESFHDKYRSSPATIYQRTIQQEAASNIYPPQYHKAPDHFGSSNIGSSSVGVGGSGSDDQSVAPLSTGSLTVKQAVADSVSGEVRRIGDLAKADDNVYQRHSMSKKQNSNNHNFPRLGLADSIGASSDELMTSAIADDSKSKPAANQSK